MKTNQFFACKFAVFLCLALFLAPFTVSQADETEHLFLIDKDKGTCTRLVGNVSMTVVFVDVTDVDDGEKSFEAMKELLATSAAIFSEEANKYGKDLSIDFDYYYTTAEPYSVAETDAWAASVLRSLDGISSEHDYWVDRPLVFYVNSEGRACASKKNDLAQPEYIVVFEDSVTSKGIMHELLHLYGAQDFYLIDEVQKAADKFLPGSIMGQSPPEAKPDELTAYIVGWADEPGENAKQFLEATGHLTQEDKNEALNQTWQSGLALLREETTTYRGMLQDGVRHGFGKMEWSDGGFYCGEWEWGHRTGQGVLRFSDGSTYVGDFVEGQMTGQGIWYWPIGTFYAGSFEDNQMTGQGTMIYSSAGGYIGDFLDMQFHGKGMRIWADGTVYIGDYINGVECGEGIKLNSDDSYYSGEFYNGQYHGYGILIHSNREIYQGEFAEGAKRGFGQLMYEDGNIIEGTFENNVLVFWADGTPVKYQ